ncbi:hypothetical protein, partial [Corynebacterium tuscaniense]|uniref:hypothetical protein n=1 Tax=Corynebacterium tuscaniense TaxID=302449 RepID=UPI001CA55BFC
MKHRLGMWVVVAGVRSVKRTGYTVCGKQLAELFAGSVSSYLCVGLFLQVFVEAVGVGHSHLVDGLFPAG